MKILKPRISIVILSICFFITSTEILKAPFEVREVEKNEPHEAKGKDISNEYVQHEIPKAEQHKAKEAERQKAESKNTSENHNNIHTSEKVEANQNKGKENQTGTFDLNTESRPSSPNEFTESEALTPA